MKKIALGIIVMICVCTSCNAQVESKISDIKNLESKVDALVKQYQDLDIFSGVVLISEKGALKYHKAFGLADRENQTANSLTTKFNIGSMSKTFTDLIILQLMESGKLNGTDKLGHYLRGFPENAANKITINNLLKHASGYGDYWQRDFNELPRAQKGISGLVARIKKLPLAFEPGTSVRYSNSGYILLGAIIEAITGKTYHQNVIERIINPLKMNDTYITDKTVIPEKAKGYYTDQNGKLIHNKSFVRVPNSDGGFYATTKDMSKFYTEYFYGTKLLHKNNKDYFKNINQARTLGGVLAVAGGIPGSNSVCIENLKDEIRVFIFSNMSNLDAPTAQQLGTGVLDLIEGKTPAKPSRPRN